MNFSIGGLDQYLNWILLPFLAEFKKFKNWLILGYLRNSKKAFALKQ